VDGSAGPNDAFWLQDVPLGDKQTLVNEVVSQRGVTLRPDERSDVRGSARVWKNLRSPRSTAEERGAVRVASTSPAAPATSHFARRRRQVPAFAPPSATSIHDMLDVGRNRAIARHLDQQYHSSRAMPKRWRFPIAALTPTPSPSASVTCRGSMLRCARPIAY